MLDKINNKQKRSVVIYDYDRTVSIPVSLIKDMNLLNIETPKGVKYRIEFILKNGKILYEEYNKKHTQDLRILTLNSQMTGRSMSI